MSPRIANDTKTRRHAYEHQKRREHPAVERQRMDLAVADRRQRHERHVERVEERPPLDEAESQRPEHHGRHQHTADGEESPPEDPRVRSKSLRTRASYSIRRDTLSELRSATISQRDTWATFVATVDSATSPHDVLRPLPIHRRTCDEPELRPDGDNADLNLI